MYTDEKRGVQFFYMEILFESLLPEIRRSVKQEDLIITFSEIPDSVNIQKSAMYNDETIPGRSEPWKTYSSSSSTTIDFTAKLVATGMEKSPSIISRGVTLAGQVGNKLGLGGEIGIASTYAPRIYRNLMSLSQDKKGAELTAAVFEEVHKKAAVLESLVFPQYNEDGIAFPPPLVNLRYGTAITRRGVIRDVRFRYTGPWDVNTGMPMSVEVSVTMEEVNRVPKGHMEVRNFQVPEDGAAGRGPSGVPFKLSILKIARSGFGL